VTIRTYTVLSLFCGLGGKTLGFQAAETRLFGATQRFRSIGGIDLSEEACEDFRMLTGSPALCGNIATMTQSELRAFAGEVTPDVVIFSPPCKGFSGLLSEKTAKSAKYQELNKLVFACLDLVLNAWTVPPKLILLENVPRIVTRGAALLKKARTLLHSRGFVSHGKSHDCGELGGLAQHRRRFLLVARHAPQVPGLLYRPQKRTVRGCGEVLGTLPLPGDPSAGPLHRLPAISWLNWVRLQLIPPGGDWRDLPGPERLAAMRENAQNNKYIVLGWDDPARTVTGATRPGSGGMSVTDPRVPTAFPHCYGVLPWDAPSFTVKGMAEPGTGFFSVADPRLAPEPEVTWYRGIFGVVSWESPASVVTGRARESTGAYSIADPRLTCAPRESSGAYGLLPWHTPSFSVTGSAQLDNGPWAVADTRVPGNPSLAVRWVPHDLRRHGWQHPEDHATDQLTGWRHPSI
jgi:site-specific DNA-cytosine methylase